MIKKKLFLFLLISLPLFLLHFAWQADSRLEIQGVRSFTHPSYTRIVVDIGKTREYMFNELKSPDRIYVDILQVKLSSTLHGKTFPINNSYVRQARIAQRLPSTVRVVVDFDDFKKVKSYRVWNLPDPFRIVIDIYPQNPATIAAEEAAPQPAKPAKEGYSMARQLGLGIQRILIDPGHGGNDPGAIGRSGLQEKGIVLDVCQRIKKLFGTRNDLEVILTRSTDTFLPVEKRPEIAKEKQADILISIHVNSFPNRRRSGVETYYLNFSQDSSVMAVAARENATINKSLSRMTKIIEKMVQDTKIIESKELARTIQKNLVRSLSSRYKNVKDLGAKGGPFFVLIAGEIPSVLVEISHLSNTTDEARLKTSQYRQLVAQGIYDGIMEYIKSFGKG